jgi:hypothetical protein
VRYCRNQGKGHVWGGLRGSAFALFRLQLTFFFFFFTAGGFPAELHTTYMELVIAVSCTGIAPAKPTYV